MAARRSIARSAAQWGRAARALSADPEAALQAVASPARTVIVGLVGVGKTTLANRWLGAAHPTGLGGVTREVVRSERDGALLIDTPGIDRPEEAALLLQPLLADADALVWVIDGLQPLTHSERRVLEQACPPHLQLTAIVARADLLDDQATEVLERVERQLGPRVASPPVALDLRSDPLPPLPLGPTPRARRRARAAVEATTRSLGRPVPTPQEAAQGARDRVRELVDQLIAELHQGRLSSKVDARLALRARGPAALEGLLPEPVALPTPPPVDQGPRARALGSFSGIEGATRRMRADAARWLADVQIAISDAYHRRPEWEARARARHRYDAATRALLEQLS